MKKKKSAVDGNKAFIDMKEELFKSLYEQNIRHVNRCVSYSWLDQPQLEGVEEVIQL